MATTVLSLTLSVSPSHSYANTNFNQEVMCLAQNIYFESRGEPIKGQIAVALVTLNRVNHPDFPKTVCGVVQQSIKNNKGQPIRGKCQFSWYCDGKSDVLPSGSEQVKQSIALAVVLLTTPVKVDITNGALFFHASYVKPSWRKSSEKTIAIGNHIFYRRS